MLYYLSLFKEDLSFLNIFGYITFRTGAAIVTAFLLTLLIGPKVVANCAVLKSNRLNANMDRLPTYPKTVRLLWAVF